jgi:hypothetical protein
MPYTDNMRKSSIDSLSCRILGNQGIARIFAFITQLLTSLTGKIIIYQM